MSAAKFWFFSIVVGCQALRSPEVRHDDALSKTSVGGGWNGSVRLRVGSPVFGHTNVESVQLFGVQADSDGKCRDAMSKVRAFLEADDAEGRSDAKESQEEQDILSGEKSSQVLDEIFDVISRSDFERQLEVGEMITGSDLSHLVECETGKSSVMMNALSASDAQLDESVDIVEGDILVDKGSQDVHSLVQLNVSAGADRRPWSDWFWKKKKPTWAGKLWKGGKIPYCFHPEVKTHQQEVFRLAVQVFKQHSCVQFEEIEASTSVSCVTLPSVLVGNTKPGCFSYVGRVGRRRSHSQALNLQQGCFVQGVVLHEMGHTIGMEHEHARRDRDEYISVHWENIQPESKHNFDKVMKAAASDPYDYRSLMHYAASAFSENGRDTITNLQNKRVPGMGQMAGFTEQDWAQINKMYTCNRKESSGV
eukprot:TRINITY_DN75338_c0_g1_i1.p1 TRINITY_DN75338_c0_g1~~TRINITY_DN75338_c0_g1_i1.p1  ORF type:complete len:421 (+),score=69.63 TRINITY_DN75338_c0_g1_i1:75-1337(+)